MVFWLFRRKKNTSHEHLSGLYNSLSSSFSHIKSDLEQISYWINHFQEKHETHEEKFDTILKRLNRMEALISDLQENIYEKESVLEREDVVEAGYEEPLEIKQDLWESLTEKQQRMCAVLAAMQKEFPDQWFTLKYLAQELYPDKEYSKVRSTVSQFITTLEELGLVKRRRKGKQTYVYSTGRNPCIEKPFLLRQTAKRLRKKKNFSNN